uniref:Protein kinase domain-containing protein n=1 Tax=Takifugu rubripes TaxID=31033 RepID=A0A674NG66_TAKRU
SFKTSTTSQRRVVKVLGEGGFGQVLKCCNLETGTMEAVKVMKSRTGVIEKAKHEIQILKQLRRLDPNTRHVVRFNSFFFNMEDICLSFEFLDVDLHAYICETRLYETGLPLPEVRPITEQLVMALHQLKTIGIIHVDIKPGNVMIVDRHEKPPRVKLVDFGGAQMSGNVDFETCICTQMYSAPEVLLRSEMNEALDMWSLGVTAFELAVGTPMFPYRRRYRLLNSIIKILGQPPDHVLDKGQQTKQFFNRKTNDHPSWTIKTDVFNFLQEHATGLDRFIDLLKNMLQVDPNQRITPVEALQHLVMHLKIISFSLSLPPFCAFPRSAHSTLIRPVIHLERSVSCWYLLLSPPQRFYLSPSFPSRLPSTLPMQCTLRRH